MDLQWWEDAQLHWSHVDRWKAVIKYINVVRSLWVRFVNKAAVVTMEISSVANSKRKPENLGKIWRICWSRFAPRLGLWMRICSPPPQAMLSISGIIQMFYSVYGKTFARNVLRNGEMETRSLWQCARSHRHVCPTVHSQEQNGRIPPSLSLTPPPRILVPATSSCVQK
jgi:hypothetical protein